MAAKKTVDNVNINFPNEASKPNELSSSSTPNNSAANVVAAEDLEEFKQDGKLVYKKNKKTNDIVFYTQEGDKDVEVPIEVIDRLEVGYPEFPDFNSAGSAKKGEMQTRFVKPHPRPITDEDKDTTKHEVGSEKDAELIVERQEYEDGDSVSRTILAKHYNLVRLLRGEIGEDKKEVNQ